MKKDPLPPNEPDVVDALAVRRAEPANALTVAAPLPDELIDDLRQHEAESRADNTKKAYVADWRSWSAWCERFQQVPLPSSPLAVAAYLSTLAKEGKAFATVRRHLATISRRNRVRFPDAKPLTQSNEVRAVLDSLSRKKSAQQDAKDPLTLEELERMLQQVKDPLHLVSVRDRAILLTSFHGAFRSGELAALTVEDLNWRKQGVVITVRRSKTDQAGDGFQKPLAYTEDEFCAPSAIRSWLDAAKINSGPLFRPINRYGQIIPRNFTGTVVSNIVKAYAVRAGLDARRLASHSLRAGYVTQSLLDGADPLKVKNMTGWKSLAMLAKYDRRKQRDPFSGVATPRRNRKKDTK